MIRVLFLSLAFRFRSLQWIWILVLHLLFSCGQASPPPEVVIVEEPLQFPVVFQDQMQTLIQFVQERAGKLNDSVHLHGFSTVATFYEENQYSPVWSAEERWLPVADSLQAFLINCKKKGLFPADYHVGSLLAVRSAIDKDSASRKNAALWTKADLLYSAAMLQALKDLRLGHLPPDSISPRMDSVYSSAYFLRQMKRALKDNRVKSVLQEMEPKHRPYWALQEALGRYIDSVQFQSYTYLNFPYRDTAVFEQKLKKRLVEGGYVSDNTSLVDSNQLKAAIIRYQQAKGLKPTGKISESLIRSFNQTNWEKFKRVVISMDRYRQLPDSLPSTYVWVNLPAYTLTVFDADTTLLQSKVIVGNPKTRTPVLNSAITQFITYPQWTVPYSIVFKEMLPAIQKNIGYLAKHNLMVVDQYDSVIHPSTIDWSKLSSKKFPYLLKQRQGDNNSLGVIKFNFKNKYSVYLHDTNARSLFSRSSRALSHGCVRVQSWELLSHFLVRQDSLQYPTDTLRAWISRAEKHTISDFPSVPLYIRYITVDVVGGKLRWMEDIYGDDRRISEKYFANKRIQ